MGVYNLSDAEVKTIRRLVDFELFTGVDDEDGGDEEFEVVQGLEIKFKAPVVAEQHKF